ncbi:hypothetical protein [Streptomyces sp. YGL11-2]|uniref:hypothetical protein n=1 Tax=Streptomyces sp. YGL11-2 TaxID=3414028 RepID=UPI003CEA8CE3
MALHRTALPRHTDGARWDGVALAVGGRRAGRAGAALRDGQRAAGGGGAGRGRHAAGAPAGDAPRGALRAHGAVCLAAAPALRAGTARAYREACPDDDAAWCARWAHHVAGLLRGCPNGPLHEGNWLLRPGMRSPRAAGPGCCARTARTRARRPPWPPGGTAKR